MEPRDRLSTDHDKYAADTDAPSPGAGAGAGSGTAPQDDLVGDTGGVVGDRLDDQHRGQDELIGDEDLAEPVSGPGTPTPDPGPGGSTP